jgi:hypothetical protein
MCCPDRSDPGSLFVVYSRAIEYATAKQVFVSGDPNAGMQALMHGKVRVQGDMAKLMASQQGGGNPAPQQAIQGIT